MKNPNRKNTLKYSTLFLFTALAILLDIVVVGISYYVYTSNLQAECGRMCTGVSQAIAASVNGNRVADWLEDERLEEYKETEARFVELMRSFPDVESIRVYKTGTDGMQIIFNIDKKTMRNTKFKKLQGFGEEFDGIKYKLIHSEAVEPVYVKRSGARMVVAFTPVKNITDEVVCYAECTITMEPFFMNKSIFMEKLLFVFTLACIVVVLLAYILLLRKIVIPIEKINLNMKRFSNDNRKSAAVCKKLSEMKIDEGHEIDILRQSAVKLIRDVGEKADLVDEFSNDIIKNMSDVVSKRFTNDTSNTDKVQAYTKLILQTLRKKHKYKKLITDTYINAILEGTLLYDVGEVSVSDDILNKSGKLTDEEYTDLKNHTRKGAEIIGDTMKGMQSEDEIQIAKQMALSHHEHYDGSGYPNGLKGKRIPLPARIIAVPDVFNALISEKSYREAKSIDEGFDVIKKGRGKIFDKDVANAFLKNRAEIEIIARKYRHN